MFICPVLKIIITSHDEMAPLSFTFWYIYFVAQRPPKLLKDECFERFSKHRSIVDLQQTLEISTLYKDSANF